MKNIFLLIIFLCSVSIIGQNGVLVPPESVTAAFEKQYPQKAALWTMQYGDREDDIKFEAKFNVGKNSKAAAVYDSKGVFKSYKVQILSTNLPKKTQSYLKKNYPGKSVSKVLSVVDDKSTATYLVMANKDKKLYQLVFDKDGEFKKKTEVN